MALMFEDAGNSSKRKWQCFVCGRHYDEYDTYKEHIVDNHEQAREYIKCPDCDAPVRDIKSHYRAKHPNRKIPEGVQMKVAVWHDFKPGKDGKIKRNTRKPGFRTGYFPSKKAGKDLYYRSGTECEFYECLETDLDVETYFAEPFKVPYFWNKDWHEYTPDIRINYIDGSTEIWEVKPANQTGPEHEQNQAKWNAMKAHAEAMGWDFIVQTEVGLGKLRSKVKRQQNFAS